MDFETNDHRFDADIKQGFKKPWFWLIVLLVMAVFSILIYIES
ncbi:MAG: hypothetical protein P8I85_04945 [Flavobacteriaceae bacterium]|jgi:Mg/Co/Ni transporter MgtE|nr:hypothetical protein [Flavobacteriaceae bacterium]|tara:strand:+ start:572 stop:700 length:129 start_codon:yes stop_codon:yes gene_type:complete